MPTLVRPAVAAVLVLSGLLVACTPATSGCDGGSVSLEATISNRTMDPSALAACQDQDVTLTITSDESGAVHLHGYDDLVGEKDITANDPLVITFTATHLGQFVIAFHASDGTEVDVGVLTVNVP